MGTHINHLEAVTLNRDEITQESQLYSNVGYGTLMEHFRSQPNKGKLLELFPPTKVTAIDLNTSAGGAHIAAIFSTIMEACCKSPNWTLPFLMDVLCKSPDE